MPTQISARSAAVVGLAATVASTVVLAQPALAGKHPKPPATVVTTTATSSAPAVSPTSPVRMAASTTTVLDAAAHTFAPDAPYAVGGSLVTTANTVTQTASQPLYKKERLGGTGYTVPVTTAGTYFVDMYVAETRGALAGERVWNVVAEGRPVVASVDIARDAGANHAWHVLFSAPVTDGALNVTFDNVAGVPLVGAVEVDYQSAATAPATVFAEDFNGTAGTSPDRTRWGFATGGNGWGNNELESYTDRPDNASLDGAGNLAITARHETFKGSDGITRNYTSARLTTRNTFQFQYGTVETRLRVPSGKGLWPAFWALGSNQGSVGWPACGEIDVLENLGSEPTKTHATLHSISTAATEWLSGAAATTSAPLAGDFHTFGMVWGPNAISISLDGRTYLSVSASDPLGTNLWNFNHPFFLLLNLAVGGNWPGAPDSTTVFPATMSVDYVRVTA